MNYKVSTLLLSLIVGISTLSSCHTPSWISYDTVNDAPVTQAYPIIDPTDEFSLIPEVPSGDGDNSNYGLPGDKVYKQFPLSRPATGKKVVIVDPNIPAWAAYGADGKLVKMGAASAGRDYCPDTKQTCRTVTGTFYVYSKKGADCKSSIFPLKTHGGAPMPYCMHFHAGYALHGSYEMEDYDASHGCVRMYPNSAKWLNENFVQIGTAVIVEPYKNPLAIPKKHPVPVVISETTVTETSSSVTQSPAESNTESSPLPMDNNTDTITKTDSEKSDVTTTTTAN